MKRTVSRLVKKNAVPYAFLLPWLIGFFVMTAFPMVMSLYLSFTNYSISNPNATQFIGFGNFVRMFTSDDKYWTSLRVTVIYVFVSVPLKLVFALLIAMLMNQKIRGVALYRAVYYIPTLLGGSVAIAVLWKRLFSKDGVINMIISGVFGIKMGDLPGWVSNPKYALGTLVLLTVWQFGSSMIIFLAALKQVPQDYYEAADIDGASSIQKFFSVTLPSITPVVLFNLIMQIISAFQAFTQAYIISDGQGGPVNSTLFYTLHLYNSGFRYMEMGYASAMAWVLLIIISVLTVIVFRTSDTWVSYGGD